MKFFGHVHFKGCFGKELKEMGRMWLEIFEKILFLELFHIVYEKKGILFR